MLCRSELLQIWNRARDVSPIVPQTYDSLMGIARLAVLPLLHEPIQSTLHMIVQQNVTQGTCCVQKTCKGTLNKKGRCSEKCEQSGVNIVQDIIDCENCDSYGFPCPNCVTEVFNNQITSLSDY